MVFYSLETSDKYLYHYTRCDTAFSKILPSHRLRMGPFTGTNDPKEAKDWLFGFGTSATFDGVSGTQFAELEREATRFAKATCKLLCFARDDDEAVGGIEIDKIWHRGFCRPRMWAQYAKDHAGLCLIFEKNELREAIERSAEFSPTLYEGIVRYRNRSQAPDLDDNPFILNFDVIREHGVERAVRLHLEHYHRKLFFEKSRDWADEKEFRWVLWDTDHHEHIFDFGDALKGVIVGPNFDETHGPTLAEHSRTYGFQVRQLNWKNGVPELLPQTWPTQSPSLCARLLSRVRGVLSRGSY